MGLALPVVEKIVFDWTIKRGEGRGFEISAVMAMVLIWFVW